MLLLGGAKGVDPLEIINIEGQIETVDGGNENRRCCLSKEMRVTSSDLKLLAVGKYCRDSDFSAITTAVAPPIERRVEHKRSV